MLLLVVPSITRADVCGTATYTQSDYGGGGTGAPSNATKFIATEDCDVTQILVNTSKSGAGTATSYIYSDSAGLPGTVVVTGSSYTPSATYPSFAMDASTFVSGAYLVNGNAYWVASAQSTGNILLGFNLLSSDGSYYSGGAWHASGEPFSIEVDGTAHGGGGGGGASATTSSAATTTSAVLAGDITLGISILIFFAAMLFLGFVWSSIIEI